MSTLLYHLKRMLDQNVFTRQQTSSPRCMSDVKHLKCVCLCRYLAKCSVKQSGVITQVVRSLDACGKAQSFLAESIHSIAQCKYLLGRLYDTSKRYICAQRS